jgi:hypothetical protein
VATVSTAFFLAGEIPGQPLMAEDEYNDLESKLDEIAGRLDDLESKLDEIEQGATAGDSRLGAAYSLGATLAAILSWHSFHAVFWALLAGLFSWLYVIYYLIANWSNVKLI